VLSPEGIQIFLDEQTDQAPPGAAATNSADTSTASDSAPASSGVHVRFAEPLEEEGKGGGGKKGGEETAAATSVPEP